MSTIYVESSTRLQHGDELDQPELDRLLIDLCPDLSECSERNYLVRRFAQVFAPPPGAGLPARAIHPDAGFSMFVVLLLLLMYPLSVTRYDYLPVTFGLLAASVLIYLIGRHWVMRRFRAWQEQAAIQHSDLAINRWRQMQFCSRDEIVFEPGEDRIIPVEQFQTSFNLPSPTD